MDQKYVVYYALLPETDDSLIKNQRTTFVVLVQGALYLREKLLRTDAKRCHYNQAPKSNLFGIPSFYGNLYATALMV